MAKENQNKTETKTRKKPERHFYQFDTLIEQIRKIVPCNRSLLRNMAVEYMVDAHRNPETGKLDATGVKEIASFIASRRPKKEGKEVLGVDV